MKLFVSVTITIIREVLIEVIFEFIIDSLSTSPIAIASVEMNLNVGEKLLATVTTVLKRLAVSVWGLGAEAEHGLLLSIKFPEKS